MAFKRVIIRRVGPLSWLLGTDVTKRNCPACGRPAISVWRLFSLGGLRTASCADCGAKIRVSGFRSLVLLALLTWGPLAGAILGAISATRAAGNHALIGGACGLVLSCTIFGTLYFRGAKLIVTR